MVAKIGLPPLLARVLDEDRGSDPPMVESAMFESKPANAERRCSEIDRRLRGELHGGRDGSVEGSFMSQGDEVMSSCEYGR